LLESKGEKKFKIKMEAYKHSAASARPASQPEQKQQAKERKAEDEVGNIDDASMEECNEAGTASAKVKVYNNPKLYSKQYHIPNAKYAGRRCRHRVGM
jgi:hypothetical protein